MTGPEWFVFSLNAAAGAFAVYESRRAKLQATKVETKVEVKDEETKDKLQGGVRSFADLRTMDSMQAQQIASNTERIGRLERQTDPERMARLEARQELLERLVTTRLKEASNG